MKYLLFTYVFLFLVDINFSFGCDDCTKLLGRSKTKIDSLDSYCFRVDVDSVLFPESSPVYSKTKITTNIKVCVKSVDSKTIGSEESNTEITTYYFNFIPSVDKIRLNAVWDGDFIYECCHGGKGVKMVDIPANRGVIFMPYFLNELSQSKNIRYFGDEVINGVDCYLLEGNASVLSDWLLFEGNSKVAIDKSTGFPVKIWGKEGKSTTLVVFKEIEKNIVVKDEIFAPLPNVNYNFLRGIEQ